MKMSTMAAWKGQLILFCSDTIIRHRIIQMRRGTERSIKVKFFFYCIVCSTPVLLFMVEF